MDFNRFDEISAAIDWHLGQLSNFTVELKEVKIELQKLRETQERSENHEFHKLQSRIEVLAKALIQQGAKVPTDYESELQEIKVLMDSGEWPEAVPESRVCRDKEKEIERANGIVDTFISEYMKDKKFLDFGCGKGYVVEAAKKNETSLSLGYDINKQWEVPNDFLTDDWNKVVDNGPYDIVLLHDVLDHIESCDPIEVLEKIKIILAECGRIYIRNHPWSSRHGGHVYLQKNLAFIHLILDEVELTRVSGLKVDYNIKVTDPLPVYNHWFKEAGFKIEYEMPIKSPLDDYFKEQPVLYSRLSKNWNVFEDDFEEIMSIDFVEYILSQEISEYQII